MKRLVTMILAIILCIVPLSASADVTWDRARILYDLGLLKGTGDYLSEEGLELDRNATRAEMCTTVIRMLGKEKKAAYQKNGHPFFDVPSWASDNIGWLYENYLVNGVSDTYFGAADIATTKQFCTMLLRVLGYDDSRGDFAYNEAVEVAIGIGLGGENAQNAYELSRREMINMCYNALGANIKNSSRSLAAKLCDEKAIEEDKAKALGLIKKADISDAFSGVPENLGAIRVQKRTAQAFCICLENGVEEYGLRVYVLPEGGTMMEIPYEGDVYMKKGPISYPGGSRAGYVEELYVYGLDTSLSYSFIVLKTSSEGALYMTTGKSGVGRN